MNNANKAALAEIDEALNDPDTFDNHGDIVQKAKKCLNSTVTAGHAQRIKPDERETHQADL